MIIFLAVLLGVLICLRTTEKENERTLAATFYYCDMGDRFHEMIDDPFMSSEKWKEWLPLFEDADRRFGEAHPYIKDYFHYAEAVRQEIDDLPLQEVDPP